MLEEAWPLGAVAVSLVVIAWFVRRGPRRSHFEDDAWASVRLTYTEQADGIFPVAVVRVQNPAPDASCRIRLGAQGSRAFHAEAP